MSESSHEPVVVAEHLVKIFRDFWGRPKVKAVDDISFSIGPGEVFGLLGPNGSGKSTTLKMILGLLYPTRGRLLVFGSSPRDVHIKQRIGYLPEESYLYPYLTCEETLHFYGQLFSLDDEERKKRVEQLLEMIGLRHARKRLVGEFSKGMMRRIGFAQALINDPDLVILDEPTSGLDPIGCRQVKDIIRALAQRGKTVLLSSHLLADVEDVCDRILILYNGKAWAHGNIRDLLEIKSFIRFTVPNLSPEQTQRVIAELRKILGQEPETDHPRMNLEKFFLDVIQQAQRASPTASGALPTASIAPYLTNRLASPQNPASAESNPSSK